MGSGVLAVALGRRLFSPAEEQPSVGAARPRRADNVEEKAGTAGVELRPTPVDPNGPVFRLNRSAALVWRNVDGRRTVVELAALLGTAYSLSAARASSDAIACLETLAAQGLVFGVPGSHARQEAQPS